MDSKLDTIVCKKYVKFLKRSKKISENKHKIYFDYVDEETIMQFKSIKNVK
jgi:hypothetical protein